MRIKKMHVYNHDCIIAAGNAVFYRLRHQLGGQQNNQSNR